MITYCVLTMYQTVCQLLYLDHHIYSSPQPCQVSIYQSHCTDEETEA